MMKIAFDNNVIIDALEPRPPFDIRAKELLRRAAVGEIEGWIVASSLTDIFYIMSRKVGANGAKEAIKNLTKLLTVVSVTDDDCQNALALPMPDFEDALIAVCAKKVGADCIVSRDEKFIKAASGMKVVQPDKI